MYHYVIIKQNLMSMNAKLYAEVKSFYEALPDPHQVSTCWADVKNEVPFYADAVIMMDDMFDTVGMASRLLYRMREQKMMVPLFFVMGGYNRLLRKENINILSYCAQELGIKGKNLRAYYHTEDFGAKLAVMKRELAGKTVVFVTSRLVYEPLKEAIEAADCPFTVKYHVAHETLEDALSWVNANAAGNGLALCVKICQLYPEESLPESLRRYKNPSLWDKIRISLSARFYSRRIQRELSQMIRNYQRRLRRHGWAY